MAGLVDRPVRTFTIGFEDTEGYDERPYARMVADRFRTEHVEFVVKPDAVDLVERLVAHHDQPFGDASALPTFLLSELTHKHVKVALCGDGGDELFAGYERFTAGLALERFRLLPPRVRDLIRRGAERFPEASGGGRLGILQRFLARSELDMPDVLRSFVSYLPDDQASVIARHWSDWGLDDYRQIWAESKGSSLADRLLNLNLRTYLLDDLLPKVDRMAMAHSLEVRSPFLDTRVVEFAASLPPRLKIVGPYRKRVLRRAASDLLPPAILQRGKRGFGVPLDRWFRTDLKRYVEDRLLGEDARVGTYLDACVIRRIWDDHQRGAAERGLTLWALLTLEIFLRREGW